MLGKRVDLTKVYSRKAAGGAGKKGLCDEGAFIGGCRFCCERGLIRRRCTHWRLPGVVWKWEDLTNVYSLESAGVFGKRVDLTKVYSFKAGGDYKLESGSDECVFNGGSRGCWRRGLI